MIVEFKMPGYDYEVDVDFVPRVGDNVCFGENCFEVFNITLYPDTRNIKVWLGKDDENQK